MGHYGTFGKTKGEMKEWVLLYKQKQNPATLFHFFRLEKYKLHHGNDA